MHRVRPVDPHRLLKVLLKLGFRTVRQKGSHVLLMNEKGVRTVVPVHPGRDVKPALIMAIIKETGTEREKFLELLEKA
ncbi:MAG: addiction module toxin, HicA family [Candidatus Verstraetearchaeota archaeon]|nr:addiction module toxin, HicA family [Candidatus Verstraetearchaeota archaeon]